MILREIIFYLKNGFFFFAHYLISHFYFSKKALTGLRCGITWSHYFTIRMTSYENLVPFTFLLTHGSMCSCLIFNLIIPQVCTGFARFAQMGNQSGVKYPPPPHKHTPHKKTKYKIYEIHHINASFIYFRVEMQIFSLHWMMQNTRLFTFILSIKYVV